VPATAVDHQTKNRCNPIHHAITSADFSHFCHHGSITCDITFESAIPYVVMAGQAKRDPATQCAHVRARLRLAAIVNEFAASVESHGRADARPLGGRLKAGHDELGSCAINPQRPKARARKYRGHHENLPRRRKTARTKIEHSVWKIKRIQRMMRTAASPNLAVCGNKLA
jgi:hypothetical protein